MEDRRKGQPSLKLYYQYISHQIEREDGLINNRINWFLTSAGLLFAAFAVSIAAETKNWNQAILLFVLLALPVLGFLISYHALESVKAAERALVSLKDAWKERVTVFFSNEAECDGHKYFPRPYGDDVAWRGGHSFNQALPLWIGLSWLAILQGISFLVLNNIPFSRGGPGDGIFLLISRIGLGMFSLTGVVRLFLRWDRDSEPQDLAGLPTTLALSLVTAVFGLILAALISSSEIERIFGSRRKFITAFLLIVAIATAVGIPLRRLTALYRRKKSHKQAIVAAGIAGSESKEGAQRPSQGVAPEPCAQPDTATAVPPVSF